MSRESAQALAIDEAKTILVLEDVKEPAIVHGVEFLAEPAQQLIAAVEQVIAGNNTGP